MAGNHGRIGFGGVATQVDGRWHWHKPAEWPVGLMEDDFPPVMAPAHQVQHFRRHVVEGFELPDVHRSIVAGGSALLQVAAVIPWRGGQPDRERHHDTVRAYLRELLPDAVHMDVDSGHQPFSRAGSRNLGVRLALDAECDVVVLCDADILPEREPLLAAIEGAVDGLLHLPYKHFRGLTPQGTDAYLNGSPAHLCATELESDWSTGGVLVIQPDAWWRAGAMDERFTGWGFEDSSFRIAADAILGPSVKHDGTIAHLWHPSEINMSSRTYQANAALAARYVAAEGNPEAVRPIVAEHNPSVLNPQENHA